MHHITCTLTTSHAPSHSNVVTKTKCNFNLLLFKFIYRPVTDAMIWYSNTYTVVLQVCYFVIFWKLYLSINGALFNTICTVDYNTYRLYNHVFYFTHLSTFCCDAVRRFQHTVRGILDAKKVKKPCCTARWCRNA
jgi:hypothetical protein